jgi:outer membrane protein assembly factor BamA
VFSRADLQLQKTGELAEEEDLLVTVREAPARRVTYALGYDRDEGWRGQLGWVHSNLFGRAVSWQTDVRLSRDTEQIRTFLQKPFLGPWPIATRFTAFRLEQERHSDPGGLSFGDPPLRTSLRLSQRRRRAGRRSAGDRWRPDPARGAAGADRLPLAECLHRPP